MTFAVAARCAGVLAAAFASLGTAATQAAEPLKALSSNGVRAALEVLAPQCERSVGREVAFEYGTSTSIRQRIVGGEAVDVLFVVKDSLADLAPQHLDPKSIQPLGRAGIGVGIRAGARRFDIGSAAEIRQALLAAKSVTYAQDGASREHIERMFAQLGIADEMKAKTLLEQGSTRAAAKVVAGEAEILLTLVSEILPVSGLELLGPLPGHFQSYVSFDAAVGTKSQDPDDARGFASCLTLPSPPTTRTWTAKGIEQ